MQDTHTVRGEMSFDAVWAAHLDTDREVRVVNRQLQEQIRENGRQTRKLLRDVGRKFGAAIGHGHRPWPLTERSYHGWSRNSIAWGLR